MSNVTYKGSRLGVLVGIVVGLCLLSVAVSVITSHFLVRSNDWKQHDKGHGHQWLHKELNLTEAEAAAIDVFEPRYREQRAALRAEFQAKIDALREQIVDSEEITPEVEHAIHELHAVHGELQELAIRHYFQMMSALPPEKQARLKQLASQALSVPD